MLFHRPAMRAAMLAVAGSAVLACATLAAPATPAPAASAPAAPAPPVVASCDITTTGRIVAIGDVHGAIDPFLSILREALLIDTRQRWIGGNALLLILGDVVDRGPESRRALDLIRKLEGEAARAGGAVVLLLGNHEVMRMSGDFRYVHPGEYKAFQSADATELRERLYAHLSGQRANQARAKGETFDAREFRRQFLAELPLGSVEMQVAFSESGDYGPWLRSHDAMARVNGIAFVHGGPNVAAAALGCAGTNARIRSEIKTVKLTDPDYPTTFLWSPEGPLWFRGLVGGPPVPSSADDVAAVLKSLDASRIVVGHTASPTARIQSHHGGRVFQIDTGMLGGEYFPGGAASALEIQGGTFTAIYQGKREVMRETPSTRR